MWAGDGTLDRMDDTATVDTPLAPATPPAHVTGRCFGDGDPLYERYHDEEWGVPVHGEEALFERIALEGFQSGLAWITVLRKREAFRAAFAGFDPEVVAGYDEHDVERLLADAGIVRNRQKIEATIANARALLALHESGRSLDSLFWSFAPDDVGGRAGDDPAVARARARAQVGGFPVHRPDDRVRGDAGVRARRRPSRLVPVCALTR